MNTIGSYILTHGKSDSELCKNVNDMIKDGWQPIGSPVTCVNQFGKAEMVQAMVHSDMNKELPYLNFVK